MSNKKRLQIMPIIVLMISVVVLSATASFAWFIFNQNAEIKTGNDVSISCSNYLQIAYLKSDGTWSAYGDSMSFTAENLTDVTSDGLTMYYPEALTSSDEPNTKAEMAVIPSTSKTGFYIEMYYRVKTNNNVSVYLSDASYVLPAGTDDNTVEDSTNKITGLDSIISRNNIAGAVRVSLAEVTRSGNTITNETLKTVWVPNEKFQLSYVSNKIGFTVNGTQESSYGYMRNLTTALSDGTKIEKVTYSEADYLSKRITVGTLANTTTNLANNSPEILVFNNQNVEQVKEIVVRIWIEGTDREADEAFTGGKFKCKIVLSAMRKDADDTEQITKMLSIKPMAQDGILKYVDTGVALTSADDIQYSYDGKTWTDYDGTTRLPQYYITPTDVEPNPSQTTEYVYIRHKETTLNKYSTICKIDLKTLTSTVYQG